MNMSLSNKKKNGIQNWFIFLVHEVKNCAVDNKIRMQCKHWFGYFFCEMGISDIYPEFLDSNGTMW